jgi:hypothetical protein
LVAEAGGQLAGYPIADGYEAKAYLKGPCRVLVNQEPDRTGRHRWHLSISCSTRYPGWNEIKDARYALVPHEVTMAMILPPPEQYVNIHPNCFHLHEIDADE